MNDLLLVIDMQKVYEPGEPWACPGVPGATAAIRRLLASGKVPNVIFTRYDAAGAPAGRWQQYNTTFADINADARLGEMMEAFTGDVSRFPLYSKSTYSSLSIPEVASAVGAADRVLVAGVVAECCVLATALSLIDAGANTVYLADAVAGQSPAFEAMAQNIVATFTPIHGSVLTVDDYLAGL